MCCYKKSKLAQLLFLVVLTGFYACHKSTSEETYQYLQVDEYKDAVYASWIGQIIGNTYGLGYEFKYIDEPGPDAFPYGYDFTLDDLRMHNGAYSDDDTDIEYMYLMQMEKHGIEPSYYQLAEAWKTHVKKRIWFANRMAVTLMHAGHYPPITGHKAFNSEWFQIDPQLVNEIWAITAPGMIDYAVAKSRFAARITSDDFGLEPTLHYAAMYSAAFLEKDINRLIELGNQALSANSHFVKAVNFVKKQYALYPDDWQKARKAVCNKYYVVEDYNRHSWAAVDATLNGALGVMALLYGQGDFQKTLDYACAFGMDADNQAATMCGLLGIINGFKSIPEKLMYPLDHVDWELPFNDSYKMITREGMEDATISKLAERTALQGEKIIMKHGGKKVAIDGVEYYKIPVKARFVAPFELNPIPSLSLRVGKEFNYPIYTGGLNDVINVTTNGNLPIGIDLKDKVLSGIPSKSGSFEFSLMADNGSTQKEINVRLQVFDNNKAVSAQTVLVSKNDLEQDAELLRNGDLKNTYISLNKTDQLEEHLYGYLWEEEQAITSLIFNNGKPQEFYGWFTSFDVEYLIDGKWMKVPSIKISPKINLDNSQWLKPAYQDYTISFKPIISNGIRIVGKAGGIEKDANNSHLGIEYGTCISELEVY